MPPSVFTIAEIKYASQIADDQWIQTIKKFVDVEGKQVLDHGCDGGGYSKVPALSGALHVIAIDFSAEMLKGRSGKEINSWKR